jgi:hypothetical protein
VPLPKGASRRFLDEANVTGSEWNLISSGNWERLRSQIRR